MAWLQRRKTRASSGKAGLAGHSRQMITAILCVLVLASGLTAVKVVLPLRAQALQLTTSTFHGSNNNEIQRAVNAIKLQSKANWCGIDAIAWIAYYRGNHSITQQQVANYLNSDAAVSPWGTPPRNPYSGGPGFRADISQDSGTDPLAHAVGLEYATQSPYSQYVGIDGAKDATNHLIADIVHTGLPMAVIVDHGEHTVLVSGVFSTGDPVANPSSVTSLVVWDPGNPSTSSNIQPATKETVSLSTWLYSSIYWGAAYSSNPILGGKIILDPDPAVGPYTYNTSQNDYIHLWIGHYVYIRPGGADMDWAFEGSGSLIKGWHGAIPSDYTGATLTLSNKVTLTNTSVDAPAFWTRDTDAASMTGPASVLAWLGTDSAHHLNIMTSSDGFRYGSKLTLSATSAHRPAVTVAQVDGTSVVALAWLGQNSGHTVNVMYDVYHVKNPAPLQTSVPITSPYPPAITVFNGQLWLGWAGTDAQHSINVMPLGPTGQTPGMVTTLAGTSTAAAPTLVADAANNQLLVVWQDKTSGKFSLAQSADGTTWATLPTATQTSTLAPDMTAIQAPPDGMSAYQWAWVPSTGNRPIYLMQGGTLTDWQPALKLRDSSPFSPALGYVGQPHEVMVVWTDGTSAHHLNVASIPV